MNSEYKICTVPRTGSHYLCELLCRAFRVNFSRQHEPSEKSITIVRDPIETIVSNVAMQRHFYDDDSNDIEKQIERYVIFMQMFRNSTIIIKHTDLKNNPQGLLYFFSHKLNIQIKDMNPFININIDEDGKFLPTSKMYPLYDTIIDEILKYDLSECYDIYNKMLLKSVNID